MPQTKPSDDDDDPLDLDTEENRQWRADREREQIALDKKMPNSAAR